MRTWTVLGPRGLVCALATLLLAVPASASSIPYGDFPVPGVNLTYLDVTESSDTDPVPLYGAPVVVGAGLDFDPVNFNSSSSNGAADLTDGQLNFMLEATPNDIIPLLTVTEGGVYSLTGAGTPITRAGAGLSVTISVQEVDYAALGTPFSFNLSDSIEAFLPPDAGVDVPWMLSVTANLNAELAARNIDSDFGVTKISVVIDNFLFSISEDGTTAIIEKDDFDIIIPEPTSASMVGAALCIVGMLPRRRRV